jgi:hypothetical protein
MQLIRNIDRGAAKDLRALVIASMLLPLFALAQSARVDYAHLADVIVSRSWMVTPGERVVFFWDKSRDRGMAGPLRAAVEHAGGIVEDIAAPTGATAAALTVMERARRNAGWRAIFQRSQAAIWLPSDFAGVADQPFERMVESSHVRSIHLHWFLPPDAGEVAGVEAMYVAAIQVPPREIAVRLGRLEHALRGARVHVTAENGTDLTFLVPEGAWFHRNTGEATKAKVANARSVRDREEELPAGVLRTTDLEGTSGMFVGYASFDTRSAILKATLTNGRVTRLESIRDGEALVAEWRLATGAKDLPRRVRNRREPGTDTDGRLRLHAVLWLWCGRHSAGARRQLGVRWP